MLDAEANGRTAGVAQAPTVRVLDMHVEGEPARLVLDAGGLLRGVSPAERRRDLLGRQRWLQTGLMREPRGHRDMFGVAVVPPVDPVADVGAVFMEHDGAPLSCGHGTVALATAVVERSLVPGLEDRDAIIVETPAGLVRVDIERAPDGSFASAVLNQPEMGVVARPVLPHPLRDGELLPSVLASGATAVLLVDEADLGVRIAETDSDALITVIRELRAAVLTWLAADTGDGVADRDRFAASLQGSPIALIGAPTRADCAVRTFVGFADRSVDRSPCGTAVSALVAREASAGRLVPGQWIGVESVSGGRFACTVASSGDGGSGPYRALVRGRGYVTGQAEFEFDLDDPMRDGFAI